MVTVTSSGQANSPNRSHRKRVRCVPCTSQRVAKRIEVQKDEVHKFIPDGVRTRAGTARIGASSQGSESQLLNNGALKTAATPIYRITVVARTTKAINYNHRSGSTRIGFRGTALMPEARGEAKVQSEQGVIKIDAEMEKLGPATQFGPEYLTYVMWAITPEGRATNVGEVLLNQQRQNEIGRNHPAAILRLDRDRRAVFRRHTTERRGGDGEFRQERHRRHHRRSGREIRAAAERAVRLECEARRDSGRASSIRKYL